MARISNGILTLILVTLSAGCSPLKPLAESLPANLEIQTTTDSSLFSKVKAALHVHQVDGECNIKYQGTVWLNKKNKTAGIPVAKTSYLVVTFNTSTFLMNSRSATDYGTMLTPQKGHRYAIDVKYVDNIYSVVVKDAQTGREIESKTLAHCM